MLFTLIESLLSSLMLFLRVNKSVLWRFDSSQGQEKDRKNRCRSSVCNITLIISAAREFIMLNVKIQAHAEAQRRQINSIQIHLIISRTDEDYRADQIRID